MAVDLLDSLIAKTKEPLDKRTYYNTVEEALTAPENAITSTTNPKTGVVTTNNPRFIGQKFTILKDENGDGPPRDYWFRDGIEDSGLLDLQSSKPP